MKFNKRAQVYKASNVTYNPTLKRAYSYDWWVFVAVIGGKTVFNNYQYSATTRRHQCKVKALMNELGHKIDVVVETRSSLGEYLDLETLFLDSEEQICDKYLHEIIKRQEYYQRVKIRKARNEKSRLESLLGQTVDCTEVYRKLDRVNEVINA